MSSARFGRCPLCGQRDVKTLDHYLPRESFPEFCVTPANLVPSCSDCNKTKGTLVPGTYREQTFHPYFDNWSTVTVMKADIVIRDRVDALFKIDESGANSPAWLERAKWHFRVFGLDALYSENAAVEMVQRKHLFRLTHSIKGAPALKQELAFEAQSRSKPFLNAWQPALYGALALNQEFCEGGFEKIEE